MREEKSDSELVQACLDGDTERYGLLVERYQGRIVKFLAHRIGSYEDAQELAQEVFLKAYVALESYDAAFKFSTWIYRIAMNLSIDFLRKRHALFTELQPDRLQDPSSPLAELLRDERDRVLWRTLADLPEDYAHILFLRHDLELAYEEIAEMLDLPLGTVKNKIFKARRLLGQRLEETHGEV
jgi:RNA polymerase sigma-70 factor (ECF subfamily)